MATEQKLYEYDVMLPESAGEARHSPAPLRRWWLTVTRIGGAVALACAMIMDAIGGRFDR